MIKNLKEGLQFLKEESQSINETIKLLESCKFSSMMLLNLINDMKKKYNQVFYQVYFVIIFFQL